MPSLARPAVTLALLVVGAALAGCSSPEPGRLALPPSASVQRLDYDASGHLNATLRVQNYGPKTVRYGTLDLKLQLGGQEAGEFHVPLGFEIAGHASEVVATTLTATPAALESLKAAEQRADALGGSTVNYRVVGRLIAEKPKGDFKIEYEGQLSPEPGVPHHFR